MLLLSAIWLATSIAGQRAEDVPRDAAAYETTWQVPSVPDGLPDASTAPADGHWVGLDGSDGGGGVWLPDALADDVLMRLELLDRAPRLCAERLDWARKRCDVDVRSAVDIALADSGIERVSIASEPQGWSAWQVAFLSIGVFALGASVGGVVVLVAR